MCIPIIQIRYSVMTARGRGELKSLDLLLHIHYDFRLQIRIRSKFVRLAYFPPRHDILADVSQLDCGEDSEMKAEHLAIDFFGFCDSACPQLRIRTFAIKTFN
jgi:hypothetical protein